mmetsp:Transcript_10282/g.34026  ORF Transcript_10282/g.34026 Transcript_10282/m.34026 type:complete len:202 (-) Transcript_10282:100-705(-)
MITVPPSVKAKLHVEKPSVIPSVSRRDWRSARVLSMANSSSAAPKSSLRFGSRSCARSRAKQYSESVWPLTTSENKSSGSIAMIRRFSLTKPSMWPLCCQRRRPYRKGWQFSSLTTDPGVAARTCAKQHLDRTTEVSSRRFRLDHAGVTERKTAASPSQPYQPTPKPSALSVMLFCDAHLGWKPPSNDCFTSELDGERTRS